jgi:hypothetical protein
MIPIYNQCNFCSKTYVNEKNLKKHLESGCEFKKRYDNITKTPTGMGMYKLYLFWLRSNGRSVKYVDEHTFIHSIHYKAFQRFIEFAKKHSIPSKKTYIKVCNQFKLSPRDWSNLKTYETFMEIYDEYIPVNKQIEISVDTIYTLAEGLNIDVSEVFDELDSDDVSKLVKSRKISPWFFLNSDKFKDFLIKRASASDREHIQKYTNPKKWNEIFKKRPKKRKSILNMIKEMGL